MIKRKTFIMTAMLLIGSWTSAFAQNERNVRSAETSYTINMVIDDTVAHQVSGPILFHIGKSAIDPSYMGNAQRLEQFVKTLKRVLSDVDYVVSRIVVVGTASPDGSELRNINLAGERAESLAKYLQLHAAVPADKIEVVNGGENWNGLRLMMEEADDMPHRDAMLRLMDIPDVKSRKHKMTYYADSKPWSWMYDHFFDSLRMGSGASQSRALLNTMSRGNWIRIRQMISTSNMDATTRQALLDVIDSQSDPVERFKQMQALCTDQATLKRLQTEIAVELLSEPSALCSDNWVLLRELIAASDIANKEDLLYIIDNTPIANGREQQLKALFESSESYRQFLNRFIPELLIASRGTQIALSSEVSASGVTLLYDENWNHLREMIAASDMPNRDQVLDLIDNEPNVVERSNKLIALDGGQTHRFINEVFCPELLYGISSASQDNWEQLSLVIDRSDLANKSEIMDIIRTKSPGIDREMAIRNLDKGETWECIEQMAFTELLTKTDIVKISGSGMSFSYELSPEAKQRIKERATSVVQRQAAERQSEQQMHTHSVESTPTPSKAESWKPLIALKTDLMLWSGVMPGFKMGTWTPNLSAEIYFARRWSAQAGYAYSNWNKFTGTKELYAVSVADMEVRHWFSKPAYLKGLYLGLYGQYGQYDIQKGVLGQTGSFWSAGLGAGWMQPLSRNWAIEAEIRGGYLSAQNNVYDIEQGGNYFNNKQTIGKLMPQFRLQVIYRIGKTQK